MAFKLFPRHSQIKSFLCAAVWTNVVSWFSHLVEKVKWIFPPVGGSRSPFGLFVGKKILRKLKQNIPENSVTFEAYKLSSVQFPSRAAIVQPALQCSYKNKHVLQRAVYLFRLYLMWDIYFCFWLIEFFGFVLVYIFDF